LATRTVPKALVTAVMNANTSNNNVAPLEMVNGILF